jgi:hypothetical protein
MVRWVVFDDDTAELVVSRLRRGAAEISSSAPIDAALQAKGEAMILLPASTPGHLLVARISRRLEAAPADAARPRSKKPAASAPKPWWRRIVA